MQQQMHRGLGAGRDIPSGPLPTSKTGFLYPNLFLGSVWAGKKKVTHNVSDEERERHRKQSDYFKLRALQICTEEVHTAAARGMIPGLHPSSQPRSWRREGGLRFRISKSCLFSCHIITSLSTELVMGRQAPASLTQGIAMCQTFKAGPQSRVGHPKYTPISWRAGIGRTPPHTHKAQRADHLWVHCDGEACTGKHLMDAVRGHPSCPEPSQKGDRKSVTSLVQGKGMTAFSAVSMVTHKL